MTSRRSRRALKASGMLAALTAVTTVLVLPHLPRAEQDWLGPLLPLAAIVCVSVSVRWARALQPRVGSTPARRQSRGRVWDEAVGGPCDGQHIFSPASGAAVPSEIWLASDSASEDSTLHRYVLEPTPGRPMRYRHAPK